MYFTKATVGCKSKSKPLGEKIELFSPCCLTPLLTPHVLAPPRADHDEVRWPSGAVIWAHYPRVITTCLSFVRTIPWSLIGLIRWTAMWSVSSEPRTRWSKSPQVEQWGAMKARSRQRTWDISNREPAREKKAFPNQLVSWIFWTFSGFMLAGHERDHLIFMSIQELFISLQFFGSLTDG